METQTWSSCHHKFILAENITILSVLSDDVLHAFLEVAEQQMWRYSLYLTNKKIKNNSNSQARAVGVKILGVRSIKKQGWSFSVGQTI